MTPEASDEKVQNSMTRHEVTEHIGIVTMQNPKQLNALSAELVQGILDALDHFEAMDIRVVILRATPGARVWSAGHNIKEIPWTARIPSTGTSLLRNCFTGCAALRCPSSE